MKEKDWESRLGESTRNIVGDIYQGLPIDEPNFKFSISAQNSLTGFQDIQGIYFTFKKILQTNLEFIKNLYSKPQLFFLIQGEDEDILINYLIENKSLIINTIKDGREKREN